MSPEQQKRDPDAGFAISRDRLLGLADAADARLGLHLGSVRWGFGTDFERQPCSSPAVAVTPGTPMPVPHYHQRVSLAYRWQD